MDRRGEMRERMRGRGICAAGVAKRNGRWGLPSPWSIMRTVAVAVAMVMPGCPCMGTLVPLNTQYNSIVRL